MSAVPQAQGNRPRPALFAAFASAQAVVLAILIGPLVGLPWWRGFRGYFSYDQLAYAAIATNAVTGDVSLDEPYTQTGTSHYPSAWYVALGVIARVTRLPVHLVWTVLGVVLAGCAVATVGWLAYRMSGRAWAPMLPALSLLTGALATQAVGNWYAPLGEHAVLWGPFGTLFTLNAEVAGLSLTAMAVTLLALACLPDDTSIQARAGLVVAAAAMTGFVANVHTYAFFSAVALTWAFLVTRSLLLHRSRWRTATTVGLVATALLLGPAMAEAAGPLTPFAVVLLCLAPAVWPELRDHGKLALIASAAFVIASAPQVLRTLSGLAHDDPFLVYRQASTSGLGVLHWQAIGASLVLILVFTGCAISVWRCGEQVPASLVISLAGCLLILSLNDLWRFNQEPYRFWLQFQILALLFLSAVVAWALAGVRAMEPLRRGAFAVVMVAALGLWIGALADFRAFATFAREAGVVIMDDPRLEAARTLLVGHPGLVMSSKCIAPGVLKNSAGLAVAAYNKGLAWPPDVRAFEIFTDPTRRASEDPVALRAAGVRYVLTDSRCPGDWDFPDSRDVIVVRQQGYSQDGQPGTLHLWWVEPA